ncbi:MAG: serine--tRNA ligase [Geothrix sp.]|uniref:serine--tRNA ligase n=1 Tax=Geothrix sp. TaxID=1962974 RepID=UPI0018381125|nr:serine--tRNA ligase [Geothrix sp.]NWJ40943.1 serine--tRNA ligase [Geothrix sp.]WIL21057.1 MAG: serine--tRNA ligase [Geothrix sp.]
MLDANLLRNDLDAVAARLSERGYTLDRARYQELDQRRRAALQEAEALKGERNRVSEEVGRLKRAKENADHLIAQQREVGDKLKELEAAEREIEAAFKDFLAGIPNPPHASVPPGRDEHANVEVKRWGQVPSIEAPKDHVELGTSLGILDLDRAAKISGARFSVLKGQGAKLERALIAFMLDRQTAAGYLEVIPPYLVNAESMYGTGQLPKFEQDLFKTSRGDGAPLYLIPTAEVPVTNLYRDEILNADSLPLRHCAFTPCFRSEAGSYGRDTKGIIRQHQFHKVELVTFAAADQAEAELEKLTADAEAILEALGLPYRRVLLCTGDMGFSSQKTYDLEVWLPSQNTYREISSCSWFGDFQARRANIRARGKEGKPAFAHTLNGSGLAVGRTWVAILENYQQADGSIVVPEALRPFMGAEVIR